MPDSNNTSFLLCILVAFAFTQPAVSAEKPNTGQAEKEVVVTIDYFDSVYFRTLNKLPAGKEYIEELTASLGKNGANTIIVRLSAGGLFEYNSRLSYPVDSFDSNHVESMMKRFRKVDGLAKSAVKKYKKDRSKVHSQFGQLLKTFDPRREFVEAGHKAGLKVIFWIDLFDDGYPGYRSKFIEHNPECVWTTKAGIRHPSIISYAFEKSRQFRIEQTRELLSSGADGVYLSMSAHSRHFYWNEDPGEFGFEAPVADVYQRMTGKELRFSETIDRRLWHHIKGEFIQRLYERIADECHDQPRKRELWIGMQLGHNSHITTEGNYTGPPHVAWENNFRRLADQNVADAFVLSDYDHPDLRNHPKATRYWANKSVPAASESEIYQWVAKTYQPFAGKAKLFLWKDVSASKLPTEIDEFAKTITTNNFNGPFLHEARDFEVGGLKWLKRMSTLMSK